MSDHPLKSHLLKAYGGFADKRIKNLDKGNCFIADDRSRTDFAADKNLYPWFCKIFVSVVAPAVVEVLLAGNVPSGGEVSAWVAKHKARLRSNSKDSMTISVSSDEEVCLEELAEAFRSIVRPGAPRYKEPSYKYVCPRTAQSLEKLAGILREFSTASRSATRES